MIICLGDLRVAFASDDAVINAAWRQLFDGWPLQDDGAVDVQLELSLVDEIDAANGSLQNGSLQNGRLTFTDSHRILNTYAGNTEAFFLHYLDGALIWLSLRAKIDTATGVITCAAMKNGRFEDITYTSLAPLLRRRGLFLIHAFAATKNGRAILIVAASHQGKTTTGLSLILDGWELLSNDAVLLQKRNDVIYALPAPGHVGIRQPSLTLLPALGRLVEEKTAVNGAYELTGGMVTNGRWAAPTPISTIVFPHIADQPASQLTARSCALSLAALMVESVDRWDTPLLTTHTAILNQLSQQADTYTLHLGRDVAALPALLAI